MNHFNKKLIYIGILLGSQSANSNPAESILADDHPKLVRYYLFVSDTIVNYSGKKSKAIAVNGTIPAPTLHFTQGDTAEIHVQNNMDVETSIHWHGIHLPNNQDGVPYLTTAPILPHSVYIYKFPIKQNGTYWYHAHTGLQEQSGLYGALIFHKQNEKYFNEYPLVLSEWTDEQPEEVLRSLRMANDWYGIKKHSTQNWGEAIINGHFSTKIEQEWKRMLPMDVSDVYYDAFLSNGMREQNLSGYKAGDKIRLRVINGGASTYFWLQYAGGKMTVVANDGNDVQPVEVDRLIIAVSETYDVEVTIPDSKSYEFRSTAEDRTKFTSVWIGNGERILAPDLPTLKYFAGMKMMNSMMKFDGSMDDMGMKMSNQKMDMNIVMYPELTGPEKNLVNDSDSHHQSTEKIVTLNYTMLKSVRKTTLPEGPVKTLTFNLTGNMTRYVWTINNIALSDTDRILIKRGENVRIVITNESMMRHPMHLHGHDFRVINGQGEYAPLKNVLDIMPMETDTIEFEAKEDGDWFFHCHILYHMMAGMGRIFRYENSAPNIEIDTIKNSWKKFSRDDRMWHFSSNIGIHSQVVMPHVMLLNRNFIIDAEGMLNYKGDYEAEGHVFRWLDKNYFLNAFIGVDVRRIKADHSKLENNIEEDIEKREVAIIGVQYTLPLFLQSEIRVNHNGRIRFQVSRHDLALSSRLRLEGMWNSDNEHDIGLQYIITKRISLSANYDSHFGAGGGIKFIY